MFFNDILLFPKNICNQFHIFNPGNLNHTNLQIGELMRHFNAVLLYFFIFFAGISLATYISQNTEKTGRRIIQFQHQVNIVKPAQQ